MTQRMHNLQTTSHTNCAAARAQITTEPPQLDAIVHSLKSAEMQKHYWSSTDQIEP